MSNILKNWILAIRPKTLTAAISPVLIGTSMAFGDGIEDLPIAFLCLAGAILIQIGTNLANDYFDFKKGTDNADRIGPTRVTQAGLIKPNHVLIGMFIAFLLATIVSIILIKRGGMPIAVIGVLSILSGIFYTAGPRPLGYLGLGDLFVFIFFGPVAVTGTYYVQSLEINAAVLLAGIAPGLFSVAILTINNIRDLDNDNKSGKRTLAVRFGRSFALNEFLFCMLGASLIPISIFLTINDNASILCASLTSIFAIPVIKTVLTKTDGPSLNSSLSETGQLALIYSVIFSIGWIL